MVKFKVHAIISIYAKFQDIFRKNYPIKLNQFRSLNENELFLQNNLNLET